MDYREMLRHCKIVYIDKLLVKSLFDWNHNNSVRLPLWEFERPEELVVLDVYEDRFRDCFAVMLYHPSFPFVDIGEMPGDIINRGTIILELGHVIT